MRNAYKFATWMAIAIFAATSFSSCDDKDDPKPEPPKAPTLEIGSVSVTPDYEAEVTITPSENAESFSWGYSKETEEPATWTKVEGAKAVAVKTPALAPGKYKFSAYAENTAGKSAVKTQNFEIVLGVPTVTFGEAAASRAGISVPVTLKDAGESFKYAFVMQEAGSTTEPAIPEEANFKTQQIADMKDGKLVIPSAQIEDNGTWFIFAYAENEAGKGTVSKTSVVYDDTTFPKLVEFEVINKTAYSFDLKVTMKEGCAKFVYAGFIGEGTYNKKDFIESAQTSLNPNPDYPMQSYNWSDKNGTFPEAKLIKGTLATDDSSKGMIIMHENAEGICKYSVAVYALDADGNGTAYVSEEFTVPAPEYGQSPTITITAESDLRHITAKYQPSGDCAKIIRGFFRPAWGQGGNIDWEDPTAVVELLSGLVGSVPHIYTMGEPLIEEVPAMFDPHEEVVVFAVGVSKDGKLGKLSYEKFTTKSPELTGTGSANLEFLGATINTLEYKVTLTDGAKKVRIGAFDGVSWSKVKDDLDWVFYDENNRGSWQEFNADQLAKTDGKVTIYTTSANTNYYIRAVAIDALGNVSPVQEFPNQTTAKEEEVEKIDFSLGKGEAKINVIKEETFFEPGNPNWGTKDDWTLDLTYTVTKGANTEIVYRRILQETKDTPEAIKAAVEDIYQTPDDFSTYSEIKEFDVERQETSMADYDANWGGSILVLITKDTDGNYKIADYYVAKPDHSVKE